MAHKECHDVGTWVNQNIQQPLEQCMNQDCIWWCLCCNKWFCFIVWVIVTIVTWVVQTVCEIVADVVDLVVNIVKGIVDIIAGIFTWDWSRIVAGLGEIIGGVILFVVELIPIVTLGTLVGAFEDNRNAWRLRDFASGLLTDKYGTNDPESLKKMQDALGISSGGFGLRLKCRALRTFIRSDTSTQRDGTPDLIVWLQATGIDLKLLAGFNPPEWWNRNWPQLIGDAGDISDADLDNYVAKGGKGADIKHFSLFSMSSGDMQKRLDNAIQHATEIGLILQWTIEDVEIKAADQILFDVTQFPTVLQQDPFLRHKKGIDFSAATAELCSPISIGVFGFVQAQNGHASLFADADCLEQSGGPLLGKGVTGTSFRFRQPDIGFKYVTIHELGHTFGLCHVDGLLRIMFTVGQSVWSGSSVWQWWTSGLEAGFIFEEAQRVWTYIVRNFDPACLETRQF